MSEKERARDKPRDQSTGSKQSLAHLKMSAPGEDTLPNEDGEMEEMEGGGSDEDEMEEEGKDGEQETQVYVPGKQPLQPGEELEMDRSAYRMYHECQTGWSNS